MDQDYLQKFESLIGCDEVGRGPIAGPVTAAAVKFTDISTLESLQALNVTDSKKLTLKKRKAILDALGIDTQKIELNSVYPISKGDLDLSFCVTEILPEEIDKINILQASLLAMKTASEKLAGSDSMILIDGNKEFQSEFKTEPVIKGDSKSIAIGLASIIAKVFRDEKMMEFDREFPGYNLSKNAGYPTREHKEAVERIGISPIHRKSFKGVKEYI